MIDYALERKKIYRQCFALASPKSPMVYLLGRVLQPTTRPITHDAGAPSITRPPAVRLRNITLCDGAFDDSSPCSMSEQLRQDQPHGGADGVQFPHLASSSRLAGLHRPRKPRGLQQAYKRFPVFEDATSDRYGTRSSPTTSTRARHLWRVRCRSTGMTRGVFRTLPARSGRHGGGSRPIRRQRRVDALRLRAGRAF